MACVCVRLSVHSASIGARMNYAYRENVGPGVGRILAFKDRYQSHLAKVISIACLCLEMAETFWKA